jgi:ribonuclease P protein component
VNVATGPCSFNSRERIRKSSEFAQVFKKGRRLKFAGFRVCAMKNNLDYSRIGLSAGKRLGGAVRRNRIKRRIRELFRQNKGKFSTGFDMVFMPDSKCASMDWEELRKGFEQLVRRLA